MCTPRHVCMYIYIYIYIYIEREREVDNKITLLDADIYWKTMLTLEYIGSNEPSSGLGWMILAILNELWVLKIYINVRKINKSGKKLVLKLCHVTYQGYHIEFICSICSWSQITNQIFNFARPNSGTHTFYTLSLIFHMA